MHALIYLIWSLPQVPSDVSDKVTEPSAASIVETVPTQLPVLPSTLHQVICKNPIYSKRVHWNVHMYYLYVSISYDWQESAPQIDISGIASAILHAS